MKILLVNPNFNPNMQTYSRMSGLPLGLLSIATYLNKNGHEVSIIDRFYDHTAPEELNDRFRPEIVGIALMSNTTLVDFMRISGFFRRKKIPVVTGGTYASILPELILKERAADYVVIGEGEQTWLELADALEQGRNTDDVAGLALPDAAGGVRFTPERPFMDLSLLGPSDFSLLPDLKRYFQTSYCYDKMLYLYLSKGCTGNCSFCFNQFFHRCQRRVRPISDFLDEVEYLMRHAGLETVYFADELWGLLKSERDALFREMDWRKLHFIWGCQTRFGVLSRADLEVMAAHGCRWIMLGVEAPPGRLAELANKHIPYDKIPEMLENCRDLGIITNISFILNYPHETEEDLRDTVRFALSLRPTFYSIHYFYPLEKSTLYEQVVREGLFSSPKTLEEAVDLVRSEIILSSFSEVKDVDYRVIRSCFLLKALLTKTPRRDHASSFAKEAVRSVLINMRGQRAKEWMLGLFYTAKYFVATVSDVVFHPGIRKKYGFRF